MKMIDRKMFERDGVSFYAVLGNDSNPRPARQCDRCGGAPNVVVFGLHESFQVCCGECGVVTGEKRTRDDAISLWNRTQYNRSHRPAWLPYAIITAVAVVLTAINVATIFVH